MTYSFSLTFELSVSLEELVTRGAPWLKEKKKKKK